MVLSVIIVSSVIIAGFEGCILASITLYQNDLCPVNGIMECFHGENHTYFECQPGQKIDFPLLTSSASCFRWIARDKSVTDVMTQLGVCTGLLTAFGALAEVLIRLLLYVFQQRRGVAAGIRRIMEKTVGINRITQPSRCCGALLPCHFNIGILGLYEHPWLTVILVKFYILVPLLVVAAFALLSNFKISITSLTYIILLTLVLLCSFALIWIVWEADEIGRIIPGGWMSIQDILSKSQIGKVAHLGANIASKSHFDKVINIANDKVLKLTSTIENRLPKRAVEQLECVVETTSENSQYHKQGTSWAHKIISRKESKEHGKTVALQS
ncbi:unnamed protein product [Rotaria sp. Silwood2]|nr:unnamed protein product [Rotaria sp. Silwood2]CAF3028622.1 unnamed protein product [Rotaria sp. Silwood2]CAF3379662.1 unnamed protein product [Rotaria sp. Silwood2]CAF4118994.1 unnamed protein product [Rotaria sp. Silwood2]CAF4252245.1 unnamed protein product [Rotaria sp. Silwood2]